MYNAIYKEFYEKYVQRGDFDVWWVMQLDDREELWEEIIRDIDNVLSVSSMTPKLSTKIKIAILNAILAAEKIPKEFSEYASENLSKIVHDDKNFFDFAWNMKSFISLSIIRSVIEQLEYFIDFSNEYFRKYDDYYLLSAIEIQDGKSTTNFLHLIFKGIEKSPSRIELIREESAIINGIVRLREKGIKSLLTSLWLWELPDDNEWPIEEGDKVFTFNENGFL